MLEMIDVCFLLEYGYSMLKIRKLDVSNHSPLKTAYKTSFQSGDFRGRPIAGQYDLPAGFVKSIESVEKLFLCSFFAFQKMNIVHEQQVSFTVLSAKCCSWSEFWMAATSSFVNCSVPTNVIAVCGLRSMIS